MDIASYINYTNDLMSYTKQIREAETRYKDLFGIEEFKEMRSRACGSCKPYLLFIEDDIRYKLTEE